MSDLIKISGARIRKAVVHKLELLDRISLGTINVGAVEAKQAALVLKPGGLALHGVRVQARLQPQVKWQFNPKGPLNFHDTHTLDPATLDVALPDLVLPPPPQGFQLNLAIGAVTIPNLAVSVDPILAAQTPAIVADLIIEQLATGSVVLPTGGFQMSGIGLTEMTLRNLAIAGLTLGETTVGRVRSAGRIPIPRLALSGIQLPAAGTSDVDIQGIQITIPLSGFKPAKGGMRSDPLDVDFEVALSGSITLTASSLRLSSVQLTGSLKSLELRGLDLGFDAQGLRIAPVDIEDVKTDEVRLAHAP